MSEVIWLSKHACVYRGFTINKCPRNAITMRVAYSISNDGNYLGCDFALAEAISTINKLRSKGTKK